MTTWRIAEGVAWVGDAERVALIDTRKGAAAVPMHVHAPFAQLWTHLAGGPRSEADLREPAEAVAAEEADEFIRAFVDPLVELDVIEPANHG